jgi:ABC-type multidrug transport system fused ATPase/permease subunit
VVTASTSDNLVVPQPTGRQTLVWAIRSGLALLSPREAKQAVVLSLAIAVASALEIAAITAVLPFVNVVIQPTAIHTPGLLAELHRRAGSLPEGEFIGLLGFIVIVLTVLSAAGSWIILYAQNRFAASCQTRLAQELLDRCIHAPYSWFIGRNSLLLSRLVYEDVWHWGRGFVQRLMMLVSDILVIVMGVAVVLVLSRRTGLLVLTAVALLTIASVRLTRPLLTRLAERRQAALDTTLLTANQALIGIKDIKLSARESFFSQLFRTSHATVTGAHAGIAVWQETPAVLMRKLAQATLIALALRFWWSGMSGGQIATQLALLIVITTKVVPAVSALSSGLSSLLNALPHVRGIRETLDSIEHETSLARRPDKGGRLVGEWQRIRFEGLGYRYPGSTEWALRDVMLELGRTGAYGLVGRSAAGKSTLVDMLVGLLDPTEGRMCVDGRPMSTLDVRDWQRRIGYVPQVPFIADDTLRANVAFGLPRAGVDDARVVECLRLANLADLPAELEQGLDTRLGERGSRLSGGQRQRVAIARALFGHPEILVFDEATSALDNLSEGEIQAALKNLRGQVMIITIAHRLSTVALSDEVFVLEQGRVVGRGSYAELKGNHDLFRRMIEASE